MWACEVLVKRGALNLLKTNGRVGNSLAMVVLIMAHLPILW
jgi:hypothetical protein